MSALRNTLRSLAVAAVAAGALLAPGPAAALIPRDTLQNPVNPAPYFDRNAAVDPLTESAQVPDYVLLIVDDDGVQYRIICANDPVNQIDPLGLSILFYHPETAMSPYRSVSAYTFATSSRVNEKPTLAWAQAIVEGLQRVVSGDIQLELTESHDALNPQIKYLWLGYKPKEGRPKESWSQTTRDLVRLIDDRDYTVHVYPTKTANNAWLDAGYDWKGNAYAVFLNAGVSVGLPTMQGTEFVAGIDVVAWHEIVGHGGLYVDKSRELRNVGKSKLEASHPQALWNTLEPGQKWTPEEAALLDQRGMADPVIKKENMARAALGYPFRAPVYYPRRTALEQGWQ